MKDLRLGSRDGNTYYLLDHTPMTRTEWKKAVKEQAEEMGEQSILKGLLEVAKKQQQGTYAEEMAYMWYAHGMHKYVDWCRQHGYKPIQDGDLKTVKVDGSEQITFI